MKMTSMTNGVKLEVRLPAAIQSGRAVQLTVRLSNASPRAIYFARIDGMRELNIRVINSNKIAPEPTPLGKKIFSARATFTDINTPLEPGQSHEWHVDLNTLYKLVPATYFVSVSIGVNRFLKSFTISVEGIEFAIQ
jgi:hypothetical protein